MRNFYSCILIFCVFTLVETSTRVNAQPVVDIAGSTAQTATLKLRSPAHPSLAHPLEPYVYDISLPATVSQYLAMEGGVQAKLPSGPFGAQPLRVLDAEYVQGRLNIVLPTAAGSWLVPVAQSPTGLALDPTFVSELNRAQSLAGMNSGFESSIPPTSEQLERMFFEALQRCTICQPIPHSQRPPDPRKPGKVCTPEQINICALSALPKPDFCSFC